MRNKIENLVDKHKGKTAIVMGLGPSLNTCLDKFREISKNDEMRENLVFISCNRCHMFLEIDLDYWVLANAEMTINNSYPAFNAMKRGELVYANSVDTTPMSKVDKLLKINYTPYDQRHFDGKKCPNERACCRNVLDEQKITIQELLQQYTKYPEKYGTGATVALHMLALSVIIGCKKIFMAGVDLTYKLGGYASKKIPHPKTDAFTPYFGRMVQHLKIIDSSAKNIGASIFNLNKKSIFKDINIIDDFNEEIK